MSVRKIMIGKTLTFHTDNIKKDITMNSCGDLIFDNSPVFKNIEYFPKKDFPVGTIVSIIYKNGVKNIIPYNWKYTKKNEYSSLQPFGIIIRIHNKNTVIKTQGVVNLKINNINKSLIYGDRLYLNKGEITSCLFNYNKNCICKIFNFCFSNRQKDKKYIGYVVEQYNKNDNSDKEISIKAYVNFEIN